MLDLVCTQCNKHFQRRVGDLGKRYQKTGIVDGIIFCSRECHKQYQSTSPTVICKQCGKSFTKTEYEIKKSKNHFCSSSCAATYNNQHKTTGFRRSKLECWLEQRLPTLYPGLDIQFNNRTAIGSELDIYFPSLKLAFELNGIYHYEPIFGQEKFSAVQNNDHRKFQACAEAGISLCIVDVSKQKYFKERTCLPFLQIITEVLEKHQQYQ